jgi:hypothetical protein
MLKIEFKNNKKALMDFVGKTSCNSPIKKSYAGYTVLPGIAIPFSLPS